MRLRKLLGEEENRALDAQLPVIPQIQLPFQDREHAQTGNVDRLKWPE